MPGADGASDAWSAIIRTRARRAAALVTLLCLCAPAPACSSRSSDPAERRRACLEHACFGPPEASPYVLPYPVGSSSLVFQTYCGPISHGADGQMSIDFVMPLGSPVAAARAGVVRRAIDRHPDAGSQINLLYVEHEDGTCAFYAHLREKGALVAVGERVSQGQVIAISGSSGTSLQHLHFGVASRWPPRRPDDVPVNFRNAEGPLDERGGLRCGVTYRAGPYRGQARQAPDPR